MTSQWHGNVLNTPLGFGSDPHPCHHMDELVHGSKAWISQEAYLLSIQLIPTNK
jgi:hypothetical protein